MLQVQLQKGEFFTIGDNVKVYFTKSGINGAVTMGIDAPRDVKILRTKHAAEELRIAAEAGNVQAQKELKRLDTAKIERKAKIEERKILTAKRKEERLQTAVS